MNLFSSLTTTENETLWEMLSEARRRLSSAARHDWAVYIADGSSLAIATHDALWNVKAELDELSGDLTDCYLR